MTVTILQQEDYGILMTCPTCMGEFKRLYIHDHIQGNECVHCHLRKKKDWVDTRKSTCCNAKIVWSFELACDVCQECNKEVTK